MIVIVVQRDSVNRPACEDRRIPWETGVFRGVRDLPVLRGEIVIAAYVARVLRGGEP
jgi:hypothetical protein